MGMHTKNLTNEILMTDQYEEMMLNEMSDGMPMGQTLNDIRAQAN